MPDQPDEPFAKLGAFEPTPQDLEVLLGATLVLDVSDPNQWKANWVSPEGELLRWFAGDPGLVFVFLDFLAHHTERLYTVKVNRTWRGSKGS
jgi:hypothetical protein